MTTDEDLRDEYAKAYRKRIRKLDLVVARLAELAADARFHLSMEPCDDENLILMAQEYADGEIEREDEEAKSHGN